MSIKVSPRFSSEKAHEMQRRLSRKLIFEDTLPDRVDYVAGVDVAYVGKTSVGAVAVLEYNSLSLVEFQVAQVKTRFPYVPTFLSFREIPPAISAIRKLHTEPDVFLVDGQGYAHPYRLGFASQLGLILDKPTVGVAKSLLCGKTEPFEEGKHVVALKDKGEVVGTVVVTKPGTKPVYISAGHKVSLKRATEIVLECTRKHRIPEPTRRAHLIAGEEKRRLQPSL